MVRVFNVYYPIRTIVLLLGETLIICASFLLAGRAWQGGDFVLRMRYGGEFLNIALASGVCLVCLYYHDLYDSLLLSNPRETFTRLVQVLGSACVILAILYYILPVVRLEFGLFVLGMVLAGVLLSFWRRLFFAVNASERLARRGIIVGADALAASLQVEIERRPEYGVRLIGYVGAQTEPGSMNGLPCLGSVESLPALVERERVSELIISMRERRGKLPMESLLQLKTQGVMVEDGSSVYESFTGKVPLDSLRLSWLLFGRGFRVSATMLIYKRAASLIVSGVGLLIASPLMALIAIAIRLDSKGPALFRQARVGRGGKIFQLYKFRSMRDGSDPDGQFKPAETDDPRFTHVGRWLRRLRLDEIPQLYNILRGDMHFVGPRPFVPNQEDEYAAKIPFYRQRWSVTPGATGWAQINREYCATIDDNVEKLSYDLYYIKNMSIGLDLLIAFRTIKILLLGRGGR